MRKANLILSLIFIAQTVFASEGALVKSDARLVKRIAFGSQYACAIDRESLPQCWDFFTGQKLVAPSLQGKELVHAVIENSIVSYPHNPLKEEIFCSFGKSSWFCWGKPGGDFETRAAQDNEWFRFLKSTPSYVRIGEIKKLVIRSSGPVTMLCAEDEYGVQCWQGESDVPKRYLDLSHQNLGTRVRMLNVEVSEYYRRLQAAVLVQGRGVFVYEFDFPAPNEKPLETEVWQYYQLTNSDFLDVKGGLDDLMILYSSGVAFCDLQYKCSFLKTSSLMPNPVRLLHAVRWLEGGYVGRNDACLQNASGKTACTHEYVLSLPPPLLNVHINDRDDRRCFATDLGIACPQGTIIPSGLFFTYY